MSLAEATVTQAIQDRARQSQALLLEARSVARDPLAPAPAGLISIRLNIRVESDFEGILDFVYALEADPLLLRVFAFSIEPDGDGAMTLAATVEAYALGMPPPPATGAMSDGHAPAGDVPGNEI
jgi:hypothetical protein